MRGFLQELAEIVYPEPKPVVESQSLESVRPMGMFTSIRFNGDELQIKTGADCCDWYDVGDTVAEYIEDGLYRGIRCESPGKKHRWWWVAIDERVVQTPFLMRDKETQLQAMSRYLKRKQTSGSSSAG